MANFRTYQTRPLIELQHRINSIFVRKRDRGENIERIYRNLRGVENELCRRRAYW